MVTNGKLVGIGAYPTCGCGQTPNVGGTAEQWRTLAIVAVVVGVVTALVVFVPINPRGRQTI